MAKRNNWQEFKKILDLNNIHKLYHFTDRDNLEFIIKNGGLYSWKDCEEKGITIPKPGGGGQGSLSWSLDSRLKLGHYVRTSFTKHHPMMYIAMNEGRITNPVILEINLDVLYDDTTMYANMNATRNGANIGNTFADFQAIHFDTVKAFNHFQVDEDEQPFYQAEILVKNFIPLSCISNIGNFGIPIPAQPNVLQSKNPYTARIDREHPTAFIFLIDQSFSMHRQTCYNNEYITMSEAVSRIVNNQIEELVNRCVRNEETRHYFDISIIGYGEEAYSGWKGQLEGKDFVTPEEIRNNPFRRITTTEEFQTRKGPVMKEVVKTQWMEARHDGNWTRLDKALKYASKLLDKWMATHQNRDCYPPTIINITDGIYNGTTHENIEQLANEIKSMFTNDGNVLFYNIHIIPNSADCITFPTAKEDMNGNKYGERLFDISSLLPIAYNEQIKKVFNENIDMNLRHRAMGVNQGMGQLAKMMRIGTLSTGA